MASNYYVDSGFEKMDVRFVHRCISRTYWAKGIEYDTLHKAIKNSLCFGVFTSSGNQVGFGRTITDKATFAYLGDVFIHEDHRGRGLSKLLVRYILENPDLKGLRRMVLATEDAHTLYEPFGFKPLARPKSFMEIWNPDVYKK